MSKRINQYPVVGTSALKSEIQAQSRAKIIEFPGVQDVLLQNDVAQVGPARRMAARAFSGLTRDELAGRSFGRMTRKESILFGTVCFLVALAIVTLL